MIVKSLFEALQLRCLGLRRHGGRAEMEQLVCKNYLKLTNGLFIF